MNCPVCNKTLATTISICFSCGAMVEDSVREELEVIKSAPLKKPVNLEDSGASLMSNNKPNQIKFSEPKPLLLAKPNTADLPLSLPVSVESKPEIQPTLVEFQSKNPTLPDWRLKVQNAVRQRIEGKNEVQTVFAPTLHRRQPATSGANALKIETIEETQADFQKNDKVAAALRRIELSRQHFYVEEKTQTVEPEIHTSESKNYPFYIAARTDEPTVKTVPTRATVNTVPKPKLVAQTRNENGDFDTNKLPALPKPAPLVSSFDKPLTMPMPKELLEEKSVEKIEEFVEIHKTNEAVIEEKTLEIEETEVEEIEDLAPFSMRFNAGIFDLLIGSFTSLILLSPFMITGIGNWFSFTGFLAFLAVTAVVMFIYLTTAIGTFGKTFGMRLFSLELVDIEENDYPTFHQAAVNSSVYLLSLALGGLGFLTIFFTEEKRAVHDIVSNTIVIKEG